MKENLKTINILRESYISKKKKVEESRKCTNKRANGITLIALIVTIIVLLILAMTTVSLVLRNNLIEKAKIAKNEYETSAQNEMEQLNYLETSFPGENSVINQYGFYYDRWYICDDFHGENVEGTYQVKFNLDKTVNIYVRERQEDLAEGVEVDWVDWANKVCVHTDSLEYDTQYSGIGTGGTIFTVIVESESPQYAIITQEIPSDIVEYSNKLIKISVENNLFEAQVSDDGKSMVIFGKNFIME